MTIKAYPETAEALASARRASDRLVVKLASLFDQIEAVNADMLSYLAENQTPPQHLARTLFRLYTEARQYERRLTS